MHLAETSHYIHVNFKLFIYEDDIYIENITLGLDETH
jgi:hypothetical protein